MYSLTCSILKTLKISKYTKQLGVEKSLALNFMTLSNIYDGAFLGQMVKQITNFTKMSHHKCFVGS